MLTKKQLAVDACLELRDLESRMRSVLLDGSTSSIGFIRLHKQYLEKREKFLPLVNKELILPSSLRYPEDRCTLCRSFVFYETFFESVVCITCHPPVSVEAIKQKIIIDKTKKPLE